MSTNTNDIPFTEINERTLKLARVGENSMEKVRGVVNDIYTREMPAKFDWNFLIAESSLTTSQEYHTGSISVNTGDTAVTLTDGTFPSDCTGWKLKPAGNDVAYEVVAYLATSSVTIKPALQGASNLSNTSYSLYKDRYSLAPNFDRFPKPGGVYRWSGGHKQILPETQYANYVNDNYQATASTPSSTRLIGTDTAGNQVVELIPPPRDARVYGYDYIKSVTPMWETTMGTVDSIAARASVALVSGADLSQVTTDGTCFFRVDNFGKGADSSWYRILAISGSAITLATAFANTAVAAGANFTISKAPEFPYRLHIGIVYGACRQLTVDQNDPNAQFYQVQYAQVMSDAKKIYVSRPYSQDVTGVMEDYRYRR